VKKEMVTASLFCHSQARMVAVKTGREAILLSYIYVHFGSKVTALLVGYSALPREAHNKEYLKTIRRLPKTPVLPQPKVAVFASCVLPSQPLTLRRLMPYIYGAPILDVSRSHTTTQHSR